MGIRTVRTTVSSAVATSGTITFAYPSGFDEGSFRGTYGHTLYARGLQTTFVFPSQFTIAFGASVVVTYLGSTTIPAGTEVALELNLPGETQLTNGTGGSRAGVVQPYLIDFGSPSTISTTVVLATTAVANGNLVTLSSPVVFDWPRAIQIVSSSASDTAVTVTVRGLDEYGVAMTQTLTLNGTSAVLGTKAFKQVNSYQASGAMVGNLSIGNTKVLGLPFFIPYAAGSVLKEIQDGVNATAGTVVAGVLTTPSATTGDVRGTWAPNATLDGSIDLQLVLWTDNPARRGLTQF
jgi:hypothetical protein